MSRYCTENIRMTRADWKTGSDLRIGIVHARWNEKIIDALLQGVMKSLKAAGVKGNYSEAYAVALTDCEQMKTLWSRLCLEATSYHMRRRRCMSALSRKHHLHHPTSCNPQPTSSRRQHQTSPRAPNSQSPADRQQDLSTPSSPSVR